MPIFKNFLKSLALLLAIVVALVFQFLITKQAPKDDMKQLEAIVETELQEQFKTNNQTKQHIDSH
jgi:hypothetical protein